MSTFTNILQQKINNLHAQIRQLQEQNYNLRRKARWLMEAAASTDMSMLPQPEPQTPSGPSGQYGGNPDRYTSMDRGGLPTPGLRPGFIPGPDSLEIGKKYNFTDSDGNQISYSYNGSRLTIRVTLPDGGVQILVYEWNPYTGNWSPVG